MYKVFVVEDDAGIAQAIAERAAAWDYEVYCAQDFRNVAAEFAKFSPHLVLLDIMLPFFNGYHWCSELRRFSKVPIIFLSSASDNMNIVMAMDMGADDFIAKPFDMDVLLSKIRALLRRSYAFANETSVIEYQGAILNTEDQTLLYHEEQLMLTKNEFRILFVLLQNRGKVVSRERLMEQLWKSESFVDENTLTVNVNRLRKKSETIGLNGAITTKFGVGYLVE